MSENLQVIQKHVKILTDKIHNKPSIQYQGGYLIGFSVDELEKLAKTGLAVILALLIGQPNFVERLMPIFSLKADFSFWSNNPINMKLLFAKDKNAFNK